MVCQRLLAWRDQRRLWRTAPRRAMAQAALSGKVGRASGRLPKPRHKLQQGHGALLVERGHEPKKSPGCWSGAEDRLLRLRSASKLYAELVRTVPNYLAVIVTMLPSAHCLNSSV